MTPTDWDDPEFTPTRKYNGVIREDGWYFHALMKSLNTDKEGVRKYLRKYRDCTVGY